MSVRRFTRAEASATLPYVRRVAADLARDHRAWRELLERYEWVAAHRGPDGASDDDEAAQMERAVEDLARRIDGWLAELATVGAVAQRYGEGGIDFPGLLPDGTAVRWSWRLGEPDVVHYRVGDDDTAPRIPLDAAPTEV